MVVLSGRTKEGYYKKAYHQGVARPGGAVYISAAN